MSYYQTIRRNSLAKIRAILEKAVLIKGHVYDDTTGGDSKVFTLEEVMAKAPRFKSVDLETATGTLKISLGGNDNFYAYPSVEAARKSLTPIAFAKYFPAEGQAALERTLDTNIERTKVRIAGATDEVAARREARQLENLQLLRGTRRPDALGMLAANDD